MGVEWADVVGFGAAIWTGEAALLLAASRAALVGMMWACGVWVVSAR